MVRFPDVVTNQVGTPIPGAFITVRNSPSGTLASITADNGTALPNPLTADGSGAYYFNAPVGLYSLEFRLISFEPARKTRIIDLDTDTTALAVGLFVNSATFNIPLGVVLLQTSGYSVVDEGSAIYVFDAAVNSAYVAADPLSSFLYSDGRGYRLSTEQDIRPQMFGCAGGDIADDTVGFQAAVNFVAASTSTRTLFLDSIFKLTAPIVPPHPLRIVGEGVEEFESQPNGSAPTRGSWLHFAHTGKGFNADFSATPTQTGLILEGFGTFRDQPAPGAGWAPTDHDYDVNLVSVSATIDMVMLNPTRGLNVDQGHYAKLNLRRLHGQAFKNLLKIDHFYDVADIGHVRQWAFWADDANVHTYTEANLDTLYLLRCDNPQLGNFFSIRHRSALRIGQSTDLSVDLPGGSVSKLKADNIDCDEGKFGLWIDNTVTTATPDVDIANFAAQGNNLANSVGILIEGNNARVSIENPDLRSFGKQALSITGTANTVSLNDRILIATVDHDAAGVAALEVATGNTLTVNTVPTVSGTGAGGTYGGAGTIATPDWRNWTPTITPGSGSFSVAPTLTVHSYQRHNNKVDIDLQFTLPADVTTGSPVGAINVTMPITPVGDVALYGGATSMALFGRGGPGTTTIPVLKVDGTTAIAASVIIILRGSYRV